MERYGSQMRRALELAERGWGRVSPNPMVGAVIVDDAGLTLGEGWHEGPGTPHAEVMALEGAGAGARGATVICTLEPCDRYGRTPPCTRALIDAGVRRVVIAAADPDLGPGQPGSAELRAAGVEVVEGPLEHEAHRLNRAFERHVRQGSPWVTLKMAATLDGKTAAVDGSSKWISGEQARGDVQRLRAWSDAILVGAGTAASDSPSLTLRDPRFVDARAPLRVVVDTAGRVPALGPLFDGSAPTLIATTSSAPEHRISAWEAAGAQVVILGHGAGGVDLSAVMDHLGKRDVQGLLVEGGATLAWSLVRAELIDDVIMYVAPTILGGAAAPTAVMGEGFEPVSEALQLEFTASDVVGKDLRLEADVHRDR